MPKHKRYKIERVPDGDHFYRPDQEWNVIDTENGKIIHHFSGSWMEEGSVQNVEFSADGKSVLGLSSDGNVVEQFQLPRS